jgi:hypothetical protein
MERLLFEGSNWPTTPIPKECRIANLEEAIEFRNHKGASSQPKLLQELVKGDVIHSYAPPLPLDKIKKIPSVSMAPCFECSSLGTSVNSRINTNLLQQYKYRKCLSRLINLAVAARRKFPYKRILAKKNDVKSAYCQMHLHYETAVETTTQIPE